MGILITILLFLLGILFSCGVPFTLAPQTVNPVRPDEPPTTATLEVDIQYSGGFYTEVFDYARDAPNVRHFVLVVPESEIQRAIEDMLWIFVSLEPHSDGSITMQEDRIADYGWGLEYLYEAPGGIFIGDFAPGTYGVVAAFLTAPLSREDAGVGDDVVLWAGVTGGGANSDLITVELTTEEKTTLEIPMTDANGWACPWLYVFDGENYVRYGEILRNLRGVENARTEITELVDYTVIDGVINLRIAEEKDEISYIDSFYLLVNDEPVYADDPRLSADDNDYLVLHLGDSIDLQFFVGDAAISSVQVVASGYYEVVE